MTESSSKRQSAAIFRCPVLLEESFFLCFFGRCQELKEELHANDKQKQKDAVKKASKSQPQPCAGHMQSAQVIANMTVGKDVSALFADVVNCIQSRT